MADNMGVIGIIRDPISGVNVTGRTGERAYLYTEDGKISYSFHYAPREVEYGGMVDDWVQTERSGNTPLLLRKGSQLSTLKFSFTLVESRGVNIEMSYSIQALQAVAKSRQRVYFMYSRMEAGLWRITDCVATSDLRHPTNNEPTRATASVTLVRASDPAVATGPVSGGTKPAPAAAVKPAPPRTYTVVKGDCLWRIANRFYGKGTLWPRIYDANRSKIKNPNLIYPAQVLVIP